MKKTPLRISFIAIALDFHAWHKQPALKSQTPKNLKELVVVGHKLKKPTKRRNGMLSESGGAIFVTDHQPGVSNFARGEGKLRRNVLSSGPIRIQ